MPKRSTCSTTPAVSATGDVFGIAESAVKPPLAPARDADKTVSESSLPGSRRCVWRSTSPGRIIFPEASITSAPLLAGFSKPLILPSLMNKSFFEPSSRVPPEIKYFLLMRVLLIQYLLQLRACTR